MKVNVSKKQIVACVLIVLLAAVVGGIGFYGLSSRTSDAGVKLVQDMQLQSILNTAGTGAVDAYIAAEKAAVTKQVRAEGGNMKAVREATAKVEVEARAKAEELGIGAVDLFNGCAGAKLHLVFQSIFLRKIVISKNQNTTLYYIINSH